LGSSFKVQRQQMAFWSHQPFRHRSASHMRS
jgi:hypothetical protein